MITFDQLEIISFAGITDRTLTFEKGLNLMVGDNESGKSSTLACLRWILYGFPSPSEKKRLLPLDGSLPQATLTLTRDGESYRILRKTAATGKESVQITRLSDDFRIVDAREPGEIFFSLDRDLFDQTALIRQGDGSAVDGKKTAQAMNNLLFSANEEVSVESALKRLGQARVWLWHINRKGGKISEMEERIATLRSRLSAASQGAGEIVELESSLNEKKKTLQSHRQNAEQCRLELLAYRVRTRKEKEAMVEKRRVDLEQAQSALCQRRDGGIVSGFVPDAEFASAIRRASDEMRERQRDARRAEEEYRMASAKAAQAPDPLVQKFEKYGGVDATVEKCRKMMEKGRRLQTIGGILCILLIGIVFLILGAREKKKAKAILLQFGVASIEQLEEKARALSAKEISEKEEIEILKKRADRTREDFENAEKRAQAIAARAGADLDTVSAELAAYESHLLHCQSALREATAAYENARTLLAAEEPIEVDESTLPAIPEDFNPSAATVHYRFYSQQIPLLENQTHQQQIRLTELTAKREDPAVLADELASCEATYNAMREEFDAIELAIEGINQASAGLRDEVSVRIAGDAADYLCRMTAGRYDKMRVDADLQIATEHPDQKDTEVNLSFLSEGTKNQAYLALRLALTGVLCKDGVPPLLMDEALVYLDDDRLCRLLSMLKEMENERQVILWSASDREKRLLQR